MSGQKPEKQSDSAITKILESIEEANRSTLNAKWDDGLYHLDKIKSLAEEMEEDDKKFFIGFYDTLKAFTNGLRLYVTSKSDDDLQASLIDLQAARKMLRDMMEERPDLKKKAGFEMMANGLAMTAVSVELVVASRRRDAAQVNALAAEREQLMDEALNLLPPDDPQRHSLLAIRLSLKAQPIFQESLFSLSKLDLENASRYLKEANALLNQSKESYARADTTELLTQAPYVFNQGLSHFYSAMEAYVTTLYAAVTGDVTRADVMRLQEADKELVTSEQLIVQASPFLAVFSTDLLPGIQRQIAVQREMLRNLRHLCEQGLTRQSITRSASPRFVLFFLASFVVLFFGLRLGGVIERVNFLEIFVLLMVSFVSALISTFGFESLRFMPWFDALTGLIAKLFGASGKPAETATK